MDESDFTGALLWYVRALMQAESRFSDLEALIRTQIGSILNYSKQQQFTVRYGPHFTFSPDGNRFTTGSGRGVTHIWDIETGLPGPPLQHKANIRQASFSESGEFVVTAADCQRRGIGAFRVV